MGKTIIATLRSSKATFSHLESIVTLAVAADLIFFLLNAINSSWFPPNTFNIFDTAVSALMLFELAYAKLREFRRTNRFGISKIEWVDLVSALPYTLPDLILEVFQSNLSEPAVATILQSLGGWLKITRLLRMLRVLRIVGILELEGVPETLRGLDRLTRLGGILIWIAWLIGLDLFRNELSDLLGWISIAVLWFGITLWFYNEILIPISKKHMDALSEEIQLIQRQKKFMSSLANKIDKEMLGQLNRVFLKDEKGSRLSERLDSLVEKAQREQRKLPESGTGEHIAANDVGETMGVIRDIFDVLKQLAELTQKKNVDARWKDIRESLEKVSKTLREQMEEAQKIVYLDETKRMVDYAVTGGFFVGGLFVWDELHSTLVAQKWFGLLPFFSDIARSATARLSDPAMPVIGILGFAVAVVFIFNFFIGHLIRSFVEQTETELDDIAFNILAKPISAAILVSFASFFLDRVSRWLSFVSLDKDKLIFGAWAGIAAWVTVGVYNSFVIYVLRRYAEKTETRYDDVVVELLRRFGLFGILASAVGIISSRLFGTDPIAFAVVATTLGGMLVYASRDAIENFLGGIYLSVDKPFDKGERIALATGEICDVRDIGMRSTELYNVVEHTVLYVPNLTLANQAITNLSRPNVELRVSLTAYVTGNLLRAEGIILDILFRDADVNKMDVDKVAEYLSGIRDTYGDLKPHEGKSGSQEDVVSLEDIRRRLGVPQVKGQIAPNEGIARLEEEYRALSNGAQADTQRAVEKVMGIYQEIDTLRKNLLDIRERERKNFPLLMMYFIKLMLEVGKTPSLESEALTNEKGEPHFRITAHFFTPHLERKLEVLDRLNRKIQERLETQPA